MSRGFDTKPRTVLHKQRPNETTRPKKRRFPQTGWKGGVSPVDSSVKSAQEPTQPSPQDDKASFDAAIASALSFIQSQESYVDNVHVDNSHYTTDKRRFDDTCRYGISWEQQSRLRELEIRRLVTAMRTDIHQNPFSSAIKGTWLLDDVGLKTLSRLIDEMNINITICKLDNSVTHFLDIWGTQFERLKVVCSTISDCREQLHKGDLKTADASDIKTKSTVEEYRRFYCALIDYITAVAARCASHNVLDEAWHSRVVASLAKCAAKMKFVAIDSTYFASQSLALVDQLVPQDFRDAIDTDDTYVNCEASDNQAKFKESYLTSSWALDIISSILHELKANNTSQLSRNALNISTVVYKTGWRDVPISLSQNQRGEIVGTSARTALRIIRGAFRTLDQVARIMKLSRSSESAGASMSTCRISFQLDVRRHYLVPSEGNFAGSMEGHIENLFDYVSVIVPLLFMEPKQLLQLNHVPDLVTETSSISIYLGLTHASMANFSAFAELKSHAYPVDIVGLSKATFQPVTNFLVFEDANWQEIDQKTLVMKGRTARSWVLEEKSIVVSRRPFVTITMTACGMLVVGGILAGFLVGERIPGVDPFNIATFTWVLAAFVILIAKSLSVREWPWRDFLRGEVACRSVSELHTVTGVDEQAILEYLLAKDAHTILATRGPFNMLFSRKRDDGFSIDVKLELRTLIASGIIVVGVATHMGPALVCLDFRRGVEGRTTINHSDGVRKSEILFGCFDFPEAIYDDSDIPLQKLPESMSWTRVLGLYDREDKYFR